MNNNGYVQDYNNNNEQATNSMILSEQWRKC